MATTKTEEIDISKLSDEQVQQIKDRIVAKELADQQKALSANETHTLPIETHKQTLKAQRVKLHNHRLLKALEMNPVLTKALKEKVEAEESAEAQLATGKDPKAGGKK